MAESETLSARFMTKGGWPVIFTLFLVIFVSLRLSQIAFFPDETITSFQIFYGIVGVALMIFLTLFKMRKSLYQFKIGSTRSWFLAHIYMGLICVVLVYMHSGFYTKLNFSGFIFFLFSFVTLSGVIGALIYKTVPLFFAKDGKQVMEKEEIIENIERCLNEADTTVSKASEGFQKIYRKKIRPMLIHKKTKWRYLLFDEIELGHQEKLALQKMKALVPHDEVSELDFLAPIFIEKENLEFKWARLSFLRTWLTFHMPLAFTLLTAVVIHVLSILYY